MAIRSFNKRECNECIVHKIRTNYKLKFFFYLFHGISENQLKRAEANYREIRKYYYYCNENYHKYMLLIICYTIYRV